MESGTHFSLCKAIIYDVMLAHYLGKAKTLPIQLSNVTPKYSTKNNT